MINSQYGWEYRKAQEDQMTARHWMEHYTGQSGLVHHNVTDGTGMGPVDQKFVCVNMKSDYSEITLSRFSLAVDCIWESK